MSSVFGFSTNGSSGGGDFLPILKFDARSGRLFRLDRLNDGAGWSTDQVDITRSFKAVFDLENLETGWVDFVPGSAPIMSLAKIGQPLPPKPTDTARNGVRILAKLSKDNAGPLSPVRELSGNAKVFLQGMEEVYLAYQAGAAANPDKLPVVVLKDSVPVKSGTGDKQSTNYKPVFEIVGWTSRGDFVHTPKGSAPASAPSSAAPSTGSTVVPPPSAPASSPAKQPELVDSDDFG